MFAEAYSHDGELSNQALKLFKEKVRYLRMNCSWASLHIKKLKDCYRVFIIVKDKNGHEFKVSRDSESIYVAINLCTRKLSKSLKSVTFKELSSERYFRYGA